jgi:hypothetical protein
MLDAEAELVENSKEPVAVWLPIVLELELTVPLAMAIPKKGIVVLVVPELVTPDKLTEEMVLFEMLVDAPLLAALIPE